MCVCVCVCVCVCARVRVRVRVCVYCVTCIVQKSSKVYAYKARVAQHTYCIWTNLDRDKNKRRMELLAIRIPRSQGCASSAIIPILIFLFLHFLSHCGCTLLHFLSHCGCTLFNFLSHCGCTLFNFLSHCSCTLFNFLSHCGCTLFNFLSH